MNNAHKWCQLLRDQLETVNTMNGYKQPIPGPNDVLLQYGVEWTKRAPTRTRGIPKACYWNAQRLAARRPSLRYVEGYAVSVIPVEHAWCIDAAGRVIDPTWHEERHEEYPPDYFGLALEMDFVRRIRKLTKSYSVLFAWWKWMEIYPLLEPHLGERSASCSS